MNAFSSNSPTLAILGGSGLYAMPGLEDIQELRIHTPYGPPSDAIMCGMLPTAGGTSTRLLFLPRHGRGHRIPPSSINYRANICALKLCGATHLLSVSAVGSMREEIAPGDLVVVDQFIDWTKRRISTFFDEDVAAHVSFADPVCSDLAGALASAADRAAESARSSGAVPRVHRSGTYLCMEGPQFSTRAESRLYRTWGVSVIGMTGMPEAKLAREAELPFAALALATDYDCWHESEEAVTVEAVVATLQKNVSVAQQVICELAGALPDPTKSSAYDALKNALMTSPDRVRPAAQHRLDWLISRYLSTR